jgi:hypothetical protein
MGKVYTGMRLRFGEEKNVSHRGAEYAKGQKK